MPNYRMQQKVSAGEAMNLEGYPRTEQGDYILHEFIEGLDYCDLSKEAWIWSIVCIKRLVKYLLQPVVSSI